MNNIFGHGSCVATKLQLHGKFGCFNLTKPWYDSMLRKRKQIRNRLRQKALKSNTCTEEHWLNYRRVRNKVNNMKKHAILNYYNSVGPYLNSKNSNKLYWKLIFN